jgi:hypothetical protein
LMARLGRGQRKCEDSTVSNIKDRNSDLDLCI